MNEEEKKALAFLRFYVSDDEDEYFNSYYISKNIIDTILNLIDNQQKEIENYQILKDDIEGHRIVYVDTPEFEEKYISKDKIKEKIEELENNVKDFEEYWSKDPRQFKKEKCIDYYKLEALKELLGE